MLFRSGVLRRSEHRLPDRCADAEPVRAARRDGAYRARGAARSDTGFDTGSNDEADAMIDAQQLAKSFAARGRRGARVHALTEVSFHAPDGAITALLGPNGAGKTTALRVLSTLVRADSGQALVGGRDVALDPIGVRADLGILSDARDRKSTRLNSSH